MGKQNWSIFEVKFQLIYKAMSFFQRLFAPNYTSFLKYTSECNSFSEITLGASLLQFFYQKNVPVENKNESVNSLNRGRDKHCHCSFELKGKNCKESNKNGGLI